MFLLFLFLIFRKALKRLKQLRSSEEDFHSFEREIKFLKEIDNKNLIKYLDSFTKTSIDNDGNETFQYFIVTDYFKVNLYLSYQIQNI